MTDYFTALGRETAALLARHPAERRQMRSAADTALRQHLGMAFDQMPPRGGSNYPDPNGDQNGEVIDAAEAEARLQAIFDALDPNQRPAMIAALAQFVEEHAGETDAMDGGMPMNGIDRGMRSGRRAAQDRALLAQDIAIRSRNSQSFNKRWGSLLGPNLQVWEGVDKSRWPGG